MSGLTNAKVRVDGGIACRPCEVLVLSIGDMLVSAGVPVLLGQTKVNDVDQVAFLSQPHEEVIWLHISVDKILRMNVFNTTYLQTETTVRLNPIVVCAAKGGCLAVRLTLHILCFLESTEISVRVVISQGIISPLPPHRPRHFFSLVPMGVEKRAG